MKSVRIQTSFMPVKQSISRGTIQIGLCIVCLITEPKTTQNGAYIQYVETYNNFGEGTVAEVCALLSALNIVFIKLTLRLLVWLGGSLTVTVA